MKKNILNHIRSLYEKGNVNIIKYLKSIDKTQQNSIEDIMISYDFQAGTYIEEYYKNKELKEKFVNRLASIINGLDCSKNSIFEAGVGEATTMIPLINQLQDKFVYMGGADISWSRISVAQKFAVENNQTVDLFVGDMFQLPLKDNSIDIVYTVHALEPNGGKEEALLKELYRVTNEYLILLEPAYEFANEEAKKRMEEHGYVKNLAGFAKKLGYDITVNELYGVSANPLNPTGLIIIRKQAGCSGENPLCCPVTKTDLRKEGNAYFSDSSLLAYPILNGVPCLLEENAIVATKMGN